MNFVLWSGGSGLFPQECYPGVGLLQSAAESWMTSELSSNGKDKLI